ncbi:Secondary metabolism regulator lae1 [Xylographa soralifera]|nr:Secondary metabolism regulator lae1 [Xylographa soralifera]
MGSNGVTVPSQQENHYENGRWFHGYRKGLYMYPCDEAEMDRMDIYHKLFLVARHEQLHKAPLLQSPDIRILDVGTGTGIWAIDMAEYPTAEVIGIDLVNIQPISIPPNLRFRVPRDYESMWSLGENSWDLIHLRMSYGGVGHWPEMYEKVFRHLKPGLGHLEQVEIDLKPRCDDGTLPERPIMQWYNYLEDATLRGSKPIAYLPATRQTLQIQGFVDIEETIIRLPVNSWPTDPHERDIGRWYNLGLCEGLEAISLGPFTRVYQWPAEDVRKLVGEVKTAICNKKYHVYNNL